MSKQNAISLEKAQELEKNAKKFINQQVATKNIDGSDIEVITFIRTSISIVEGGYKATAHMRTDSGEEIEWDLASTLGTYRIIKKDQ